MSRLLEMYTHGLTKSTTEETQHKMIDRTRQTGSVRCNHLISGSLSLRNYYYLHIGWLVD